jgi:hypothetical protein
VAALNPDRLVIWERRKVQLVTSRCEVPGSGIAVTITLTTELSVARIPINFRIVLLHNFLGHGTHRLLTANTLSAVAFRVECWAHGIILSWALSSPDYSSGLIEMEQNMN